MVGSTGSVIVGYVMVMVGSTTGYVMTGTTTGAGGL